MRPSIDDVWLAVALAVPVLVILGSSMRTVDLAYHLRLGQAIVAGTSIPRIDTFTFTASGEPWLDQQWLAQAMLHLVHRGAGFAGLIVLRASLVAIVVVATFASCRARGAGVRSSSLLCLGSFVLALPHLAMRPQLFGAVAFALSAFVLVTRRAHPGRLWLLPVIAVAWANLHGSFVLAPALVGLVVITDVLAHRRLPRHLVPVLAATVVATFVTPWGPAVWRYAAALATDETIRTQVTEWAPPSFSTFAGAMFLLTLVGLTAWLGLRARALAATDVAWVVAFTVLALASSRNVLWWALAVPVVLAASVGPLDRASGAAVRGSRPLNAALLVVLGAGLVVALPWWRPAPSLVEGTPSAALMAAADASVPSGANLFVHQPWASWLEFSRPDLRVFVDSRIELFDDATWSAYDDVVAARGPWRAALVDAGADAVMVPRANAATIEGLGDDPGWVQIAGDETGALFVRG